MAVIDPTLRPGERLFPLQVQGGSVALSPDLAAADVQVLRAHLQNAASAFRLAGRRSSQPERQHLAMEALMAIERAGDLLRPRLVAEGRAADGPTSDVRHCMLSAQSVARAATSKTPRFEILFATVVPRAACDPVDLQAAIFHLINNAIDAVADTGTIRLSGRRILSETGSAVEIAVVDDGVGMRPATLARAFDPSFSTKPCGTGGFGLHLARCFARDNGGDVTLSSRYGRGTRASLRLPAGRYGPGPAFHPQAPIDGETGARR